MEMLSEELNLRLFQVADSLMNILQVQITEVINSAINNKVIPAIQNAMGTLSSGQKDTESGSSQNNQEDREGSNGPKTKIIKKDSRSACNLRDTEGRSLYNCLNFICWRFFLKIWQLNLASNVLSSTKRHLFRSCFVF